MTHRESSWTKNHWMRRSTGGQKERSLQSKIRLWKNAPLQAPLLSWLQLRVITSRKVGNKVSNSLSNSLSTALMSKSQTHYSRTEVVRVAIFKSLSSILYRIQFSNKNLIHSRAQKTNAKTCMPLMARTERKIHIKSVTLLRSNQMTLKRWRKLWILVQFWHPCNLLLIFSKTLRVESLMTQTCVMKERSIMLYLSLATALISQAASYQETGNSSTTSS